MAIIFYVILLLLGILISLVGNIIGIVQAFQESAVWGLLYLFLPFAALVFLIKFWERPWVRRSLWAHLIGLAFILMSLVVVALNVSDFKQAPFNGVPLESRPTESDPVEPTAEPTSDPTAEPTAEPTPDPTAPGPTEPSPAAPSPSISPVPL
jgi:glucan phosphoethanolaminetransferase (alkaline phosphatase superfamily)